MQETGFVAEPGKLGGSIGNFAQENVEYYTKEFEKIQSTTKFPFSWNTMAAVFGPFWGAARGMWGYFWTFTVLELLALVQLGKGIWGELGADKLARVDTVTVKINSFMVKYEAAIAANSEDAAGFLKRAENLQKVVDKLHIEAVAAAQDASLYLAAGVIFFVALRIVQGFYGNMKYEKQYITWRAEPDKVVKGRNWNRVGFGAIMWLAIVPLTLYRFTVAKISPELELYTGGFPIGKKEYFSPIAKVLENGFDWLSDKGSGAFDTIVFAIRSVLDGLETVFVETPWPVVIIVIVVLAWRLAGPRVAVFTLASLGYLGFLGMWETSMITVSLLGAAAFLCLIMGIPIGIWFGKNQRAYNAALPVLDFMQTMPAFVYLIPIIAFFGTGKPPGVLATLIFGMPPVIRLTALGIRGVPETTKEAARAFGCTRWTLLKDIEIPLAMPSIMTGINQTILMCLSMVVIASLIGAKGLGQDVLDALQYAAKGQGVLAGLAILFCAMVIDRIIQGHYKQKTQKYQTN